MYLYRGNSYTEIYGEPDWFLGHLRLHLSVPVEAGTAAGARFGSVYLRYGQHWGSMLSGRRVPAGLTDRVARLARYYTSQGYPVPVEVVDRRERPPERYPWQCVSAAWRPYQDEIHRRIVRRGVGVVDAPPRSGKTLMAARAIDALALPAAYVAPSVAIVRQTYETLRRYLGDEVVARYDGDEKGDLDKPVVVTTMPSAVKLPQAWWATRGVLVIDEWHHVASETGHQINALAEHVFYRLGFTGTHWRTGEDEMAMEAVCSDVLASVPVARLVAEGYLAEPFVRFAPFRAEPFEAPDWMRAYERGVVQHEQRNAVVAGYASQLADRGHQVIVLVSRRKHADYLASIIDGAEVAKGGEGALTSRTIRDFTDRKFPVLVGTSVIGEGVDVPSASALVYAGGLGDSVQMMQSYFRPLTATAGKTHGCVYDFVDLHHPTLQRHSEDRLRLARQQLGQWVSVV